MNCSSSSSPLRRSIPFTATGRQPSSSAAAFIATPQTRRHSSGATRPPTAALGVPLQDVHPAQVLLGALDLDPARLMRRRLPRRVPRRRPGPVLPPLGQRLLQPRTVRPLLLQRPLLRQRHRVQQRLLGAPLRGSARGDRRQPRGRRADSVCDPPHAPASGGWAWRAALLALARTTWRGTSTSETSHTTPRPRVPGTAAEKVQTRGVEMHARGCGAGPGGGRWNHPHHLHGAAVGRQGRSRRRLELHGRPRLPRLRRHVGEVVVPDVGGLEAQLGPVRVMQRDGGSRTGTRTGPAGPRLPRPCRTRLGLPRRPLGPFPQPRRHGVPHNLRSRRRH